MVSLFAQTAWQVAFAGLVLGAGLPLLFAFGVRLSTPRAAHPARTATAPSPAARLLAFGCFAVVVGAVVLGLTIIVATGFGKVVTFEHVLPLLVDKP